MTCPLKTDPDVKFGFGSMRRSNDQKQFSIEQIITKLREAKISLYKGATIATVCRSLEVTEQTYYRWRKLYGGMRKDQDMAGTTWSKDVIH